MAVNNLNTPGVGIQPSLIDAKGDLLVGTGNDAIDRLGVTGPTGSVLVTDAGETTGLKWVDPGTVGGLVHINTTTFSAVASQSINDVFSSTYDNYRILFNNITWSSVATTASLTLRLRSSGTDTSANYTLGGLYMHHNSTTITGDVTSPAVFLGNTSGNNGKVFGYIEIYSPKLANETSGVYFKPYRFTTGSSGAYTHGYSFFQTDNTQFDGFSLVASAGAINGSVSIYGYKK